ncbi:MAG: hypothetical protein IKU42_08475 [Oscillospiraceae bacterium]|nr:hypothetical protein [Oscillospiraceae bacterium]
MFFDSLAVLLLTFFASLGMVEAGEWLLKNPFRKDIKKTVFVVAKVNSVPDEDIEPALRTLLSETEGQARKVFLDCSGASESAVIISKNLEKRFDCETVFNEAELFSLTEKYLHGEEKTV